jgi:transmembrane sensor
MNNKESINWELLAKYLDQEMDDPERKEFERTIQTDPKYGKVIAFVQGVWNETKKKKNMIEVNTDSAWEKLKSRIENQKAEIRETKNVTESSYRKIFTPVLRIAAVIMVVMGLSYLVFRAFIMPLGDNTGKLTVSSEPDRMMQTTLPDGSVVHLKANSSISYEHQKTGIRELALEGEAFFDIAPDPDQPFVISADQALVKVVGTSFSVEADKENNIVNVFVESGLVLLSDKSNGDHSLVIEPGYMGILSKKGIDKKLSDDKNYLAWKSGKLEFHESGFEAVINDLNHTYGTNIVSANDEMSECDFTGTFLNQPVDTVLKVLQTAFNLDIEITDSEIILSGEGCK